VRLSCLARNGRSPGEESRPAGVAFRRSRRSRPSARSSQGEAVWSARRTAPSGEDLAKIGWLAQEAWHLGRGERCRGVQKGRGHDPTTRANDGATERLFVGQEAWGRPVEARFKMPHSRSRGRAVMAPIYTNLFGDEALAHPSLVAAVRKQGSGFTSMPCPKSGVAYAAMRSQAVPPTITAPTMAKASCHASDGIPISASPCVAL